MITNKIISSSESSDLTVTDIAKIAGTSRARITKILKNDTHGISLDVLVRVLGALGEEMKISFKKAAKLKSQKKSLKPTNESML